MPTFTQHSLQTTARQVIVTYMTTNYPSIVLIADNAVDEPSNDDTYWARLMVEGLPTILGEIGATKRHRLHAFLTVQMFIPIGHGTGPLTETLSALEGHVRSKVLSGVTFRQPRINVVGRSGRWYQANFTVEIHGDHIG